jgi:hypothetical protein
MTRAVQQKASNCFLCSNPAESNGLCNLCNSQYLQSIEPTFNKSGGQEYADAPEVESIAVSLIPAFHQHLNIPDLWIHYVFLKNTPKSKDKLAAGRARKVTGLAAWMSNRASAPGNTSTEPFFMMEISWDLWTQLKPAQKVALVDHELAHFGIDQKGELFLKGHDLEEFTGIVRRHGFWKEEVKQFVEAAREKEAAPLFAPAFPANQDEPDDDGMSGMEQVE